MAKKRKLSNEEKQLYLKSTRRHSDELSRAEIRLREVELLLAEGLYLNYIMKKEEFEKTRRRLVTTITNCKIEINIANDAIKNGVVKK